MRVELEQMLQVALLRYDGNLTLSMQRITNTTASTTVKRNSVLSNPRLVLNADSPDPPNIPPKPPPRTWARTVATSATAMIIRAICNGVMLLLSTGYPSPASS